MEEPAQAQCNPQNWVRVKALHLALQKLQKIGKRFVRYVSQRSFPAAFKSMHFFYLIMCTIIPPLWKDFFLMKMVLLDD
jgi:hypothetical protein